MAKSRPAVQVGSYVEAVAIRTGDGWQPGVQFAVDSPLEGDGFELSVPRRIGNGFEISSETGPIEHRAAVSSENLPALGKTIESPQGGSQVISASRIANGPFMIRRRLRLTPTSSDSAVATHYSSKPVGASARVSCYDSCLPNLRRQVPKMRTGRPYLKQKPRLYFDENVPEEVTYHFRDSSYWRSKVRTTTAFLEGNVKRSDIFHYRFCQRHRLTLVTLDDDFADDCLASRWLFG
jgi:hypothetical protein